MNYRLLAVLIYHVGILANGNCQELSLVKEVAVNQPVSVSLDRRGSLYIAERSGDINKYTSEGELEVNFASIKNSIPSLLEAWTSLDILVFYEGTQRVAILDRFLTPISDYAFRDHFGFARLATIGAQGNLWIVDDVDFSLNSFNPELNLVPERIALNQILDPADYQFTFMREYQNLLFISDIRSGILVFDNLGNYLKKFPANSVHHFGFFGNEIYFQSSGGLQLIDIYTGESRFMETPPGDFVIMTDKRIYAVGKKMLKVFSY